MIVGLLLLNNPDIELISTIGTLLMCFGYFPISMRLYTRHYDYNLEEG